MFAPSSSDAVTFASTPTEMRSTPETPKAIAQRRESESIEGTITPASDEPDHERSRRRRWYLRWAATTRAIAREPTTTARTGSPEIARATPMAMSTAAVTTQVSRCFASSLGATLSSPLE